LTGRAIPGDYHPWLAYFTEDAFFSRARIPAIVAAIYFVSLLGQQAIGKLSYFRKLYGVIPMSVTFPSNNVF
jgi:hypothetical protein